MSGRKLCKNKECRHALKSHFEDSGCQHDVRKSELSFTICPCKRFQE